MLQNTKFYKKEYKKLLYTLNDCEIKCNSFKINRAKQWKLTAIKSL